MIDFTEQEMISAFKQVEKLYYRNNFGSTSKADLDTLFFSIFMEHCRAAKEPYDDYSLSKVLGISQSRIRTLKEKKQLRYPYIDQDKNNWKIVFAEEIRNAKYDKDEHKVRIIVNDVNVLNEVRHYIETKGWYDEYSLNRRLLTLPLECFTEVFLDDETEDQWLNKETLAQIKRIAPKDEKIQTFISEFTEEGFKKFLSSASKVAIAEVLKLLPFGGLASAAVTALIKVIEAS